MTTEDIAKKISEIMDERYSHCDVHYVDYGFMGKHSILTSYQGMSPFTFSILEDGTIYTTWRTLIELKMQISEKLGHNTPDDGWNRILEAERWIKENNVVEIIKENLSPYYKEKMINDIY